MNYHYVSPKVASVALPGISPVISKLQTAHRSRSIAFHSGEYRQSRFRVRLYRFMAESIPLINSVLWTWTRLTAAPGTFRYMSNETETTSPQADIVLKSLFQRISTLNFGSTGNAEAILTPFFNSLFLDGAVAGQVRFYDDFSGIEQFSFFDLASSDIHINRNGVVSIIVAENGTERAYSGNDIFFFAHNADIANPYGKSILQAVPFVSFIEQQLVDDMRRAMHNSGYHRLHVKISPPEKREDETDEAYVKRANAYFDDTVSMIRDIKTEDNPITWDDVNIEYIGPKHQGGTRSNNWYITHRAMVEEVCSGTNLAPFLLGYAYNATTNWAQFKYDLIMRQVHSLQYAATSFLNWLANMELALKGFSLQADWKFSNRFSALAKEQTQIKKDETARIIDLYKAGLIDRETAAQKARELL